MSHTVLKGALIGCGFFGKIQAEAWTRTPGVQIVAACDPDIERAREVSPAAFANAGEMLAQADLDFVDIATRPDSHVPLVQLAAERSLPVICQKPLANSVAEARAIHDIAADSGVLVMVHENWRWQPWFREAARLISAGAIGDPICYHFRIRQRDGAGANAYPNQPYFRDMPRLHVHETLVHPIDTARFFFGDICSVSAQLRRLNPLIAGEDRALLTLAHRSQVDGVIDGHRFLDPDPRGPAMGETRLEGHEGVLHIKATGELMLNGRAVYTPPQNDVGYKGDSARAVQIHFIECLRGEAEPECRVDQYWNTFAAVEAAYASAATGRTVAVS
ncbi:MAG TPA: Gfo/Idh/MocA family oxidoreductase [Bryobacteraceae bacterium]|nr:Gfo/Idh/MocA family oxidoreductase [Bryobacteraceae bacterium]